MTLKVCLSMPSQDFARSGTILNSGRVSPGHCACCWRPRSSHTPVEPYGSAESGRHGCRRMPHAASRRASGCPTAFVARHGDAPRQGRKAHKCRCSRQQRAPFHRLLPPQCRCHRVCLLSDAPQQKRHPQNLSPGKMLRWRLVLSVWVSVGQCHSGLGALLPRFGDEQSSGQAIIPCVSPNVNTSRECQYVSWSTHVLLLPQDDSIPDKWSMPCWDTAGSSHPRATSGCGEELLGPLSLQRRFMYWTG